MKKKKINVKQMICNWLMFICILLFAWFSVSVINVILNNDITDDTYRQYANWNLFTVMGLVEGE